jgi:hypothetical protein
MSRILNTKTAAAVALTILLGLTAFPLAAAGETAHPAATVGVWQQAWDFLFGGGLTSLRAEDGGGMDPNGRPSTKPPSGGLTAFHGEEGGCMDPNGRPILCARSSGLTSFRDHRSAPAFRQ